MFCVERNVHFETRPYIYIYTYLYIYIYIYIYIDRLHPSLRNNPINMILLLGYIPTSLWIWLVPQPWKLRPSDSYIRQSVSMISRPWFTEIMAFRMFACLAASHYLNHERLTVYLIIEDTFKLICLKLLGLDERKFIWKCVDCKMEVIFVSASMC